MAHFHFWKMSRQVFCWNMWISSDIKVMTCSLFLKALVESRCNNMIVLNGKIGSDFLGVSGRLPTGSTRIWMDWDRRTVIGEQSVASIPFIKNAFKQASEKELFVLLFGVGRSSFFLDFAGTGHKSWAISDMIRRDELDNMHRDVPETHDCHERRNGESKSRSLGLSIHAVDSCSFCYFCSCLLSPMLNTP